MADLKQTFILRALSEYNEMVIETMRAEKRRLKVEDTGASDQSFAYEVFQSGEGAYSQLSFAQYLRFVDMGVGRGHPLGGLKAVSEKLAFSSTEGKKFVKDNIRRPKKIYSKVAYGKLNFLATKLMYGYTDEVIANLKAELENPTPNS